MARDEAIDAGRSIIVPLPTRKATIDCARKLAPKLAPGDGIILSGDLGAGKTFFTRALCRALGVSSDHRITSPTFTLVHEHRGASMLIAHADVYRLRSRAEVVDLGLVELRDRGALLVVEWGEPFLTDLGGDMLIIALETPPDAPRRAALRATGPRSSAIVRAMM